MNETREFTAMPDRIKKLPLDERGYPVPWFVAWVDGKPEFRAMDNAKLVKAIKEKRCWVCGDMLGINVVFVAGPMCAINRTSAEPPSHLDCARWSAINCPFLNNPQMVRREDTNGPITNQQMRDMSAGIALTRNPGVAMLWITRQFEVFNDGKGKPLIQMGEPSAVEWYCSGRKATREEVQNSIESGLPSLEAVARTEKGAMEALERYKQRLAKWLPAWGL